MKNNIVFSYANEIKKSSFYRALFLQVQYVATENGWPGKVEPSPVCDTCTPAYPCTIGTDTSLNVTSGFNYGFQVEFSCTSYFYLLGKRRMFISSKFVMRSYPQFLGSLY